MSRKSDFDIKKLSGSANYHFWKFQMENYLALKKLQNCIKPKANLPAVSCENDSDKLTEAKSILSLSIDESLIVHIQKAKTPIEIWSILQHLYEDKGLLRRTGLLRALMSVRLESTNSMQEYVEEIMTISNRLTGIGFEIGDEWIASILLAGLTEDYKPFILSIEGSGVPISADMIKQKLLDSDVGVTSGNNSQGSALYTWKKQKSRPRSKEYTCFACGGKNHKASDCKKGMNRTAKNRNVGASSHSPKPVATAKVVQHSV